MGEWKETALGEVLDFGNGKSRPLEEGSIPVYGGNGILGYTNRSNYSGKTIAIGRVGAYCGAVYFEDGPVWISDNALAAKAKAGNDSLFFYYLLKNADLNQHAGGSSHPLVTQTLLNSLEFTMCRDEDDQRAIASVLSSLDAKIDLLHRQNKTLEAMAEALFRQWFTGQRATGEETVLGSVVNVLEAGRRPSGGVFGISSGVPSIGAESIVGLGHFDYSKTKYVPREYYESMQRGKVQDMDVLLYKDGGTPGEFEPHATMVGRGFPFSECCINEHVFRIRTEPVLPQSYLYFWLTSDATMEEMRNSGTGAAIPGLTASAVRELPILKPSAHVLEQFTNVVDPMVDRILANCRESRTLANLRDTLLPKLMSGVVRVEETIHA